MNRASLRLLLYFLPLKTGGVAFLMFVLLFADGLWATLPGYIGSYLREIAAVCRDAETQWMLVLCLACYFVVFVLLERRAGGSQRSEDRGQRTEVGGRIWLCRGNLFNPNFWLSAFVVAVLLRYALTYETAVRSLQIPVLLAGMVFGKGIAVWVGFGFKFRHLTPALSPSEAEREKTRHLTPALSPNEAEREKERRSVGIIFILLALLAGAALWQPEAGATFSYHGIPRWSGVWSNPNLYGLLMGVGVVLAVGLLIHGVTSNTQLSTINYQLRKHVVPLACLIAAILCGVGLFKSYSRGAWLGTAVGMGFLLASGFWRLASGGLASKSETGNAHLTPALSPRPTGGEGGPSSILHPPSSRMAAWLRTNQLSLAVLLVSLATLAFWQFRFSEARPAQRIFSASNPNDFSWRNRVTAWLGAGRMMLDRPLTGFGWGEAETVYGKKYCPTNESAAIEMNDYLMLGISAGVPAMVCFLVYLGMALKTKAEMGNLKPETSQSLLTSAATPQESNPETGGTHCPTLNRPSSIFHPPSSILHAATCRAGAIVLLVGFWFDGGLFKLPVAIVFWMLIELARMKSSAGDEVTSLTSQTGSRKPKTGNQSESPYVVSYTKMEKWLRWLAALLALAASAITAIHFVVPRLEVNDHTLTIARKFLVQSKERADFEILAEQSIWHGTKLKTLLEHVELAGYNRELINWKLDDKIYQDFVLSPVLELSTLNSNLSTNLAWRRQLWEEFYPRIRHESSPEDAAKIVVSRLRGRVTIAALPNPSRDVPEIFLKQVTDEAGFLIVCVAALRSVGVPARLNPNNQAEFFDGAAWRPAP